MSTTILVIELLFFVGVFSYYLPSFSSSKAPNFHESTTRTAIPDEANKIVGGTPALEGEFPYQAFLNLSIRSCGGTLISPSIVLTAAHCFEGLTVASTSAFTVTVNTTKRIGGIGAVRRGVKKFVVHPLFNKKTFDNNVALLALSYPIKNVRLVKLPSAYTTSTYAGRKAVIVGWGDTSSGGRNSNNLLKATVTVLTNEAFSLQYKKLNTTITNNMVCAAAPGKDTCQGWPLLVEGVQIGITSFGAACADPRFAGVYTRVTRYITWIKATSYAI
ncbi:trypsin Blo t 3-like [Daphnia carinata]|uniref:trypsin Blo t 3-like n=1 Tax=Daphnia carinata TaxID=120202 RepID=UPI00257BD7A0|nr:trypsin Blo t 3-like [Daphnia carinata]